MTSLSEHGQAPPPAEISRVVEHLFRHEAGKMVATLTRIFGIEHLTLAEDVVQEALARALQTWPFYGVPQNPPTWIMRTSRNLALDVVRRDKVFRDKQPDITRLMGRLERLGLALRRRQRDYRRVIAAHITARGLSLLSELDQTVVYFNRSVLGHLGQRRLQLLIQLLESAGTPTPPSNRRP